MKYTTTLSALRKHDPCASGWRKLLTHLGTGYPENQPITLATILKSNGWRDAVWSLRAVNEVDRDARLFACDCAELVLTKFEAKYPEDRRPRTAIEMARRFADGLATSEELRVARSAAYADAAADAANAAANAAYACYAANAAYTAANAAIEKLFTERFCK